MSTRAECPAIDDGWNILTPVLLWNLSKPRKATIAITPQAAKIRYRYPSENWQEIIADNWTIQPQTITQTQSFSWYSIHAQGVIKDRFPYVPPEQPIIYSPGQIVTCRVQSSYPGEITNVWFDNSQSNWRIHFNYNQPNSNGTCTSLPIFTTMVTNSSPARVAKVGSSTSVNPGFLQFISYQLIEDTSKTPIVCKKSTNQCTFTAFCDSQIVHQEIRSTCPEVQNLGCFLDSSKQKTVEVELNPFDILYISTGTGGIIGTVFANFLNALSLALQNIPFATSLLQTIEEFLKNNPPECTLITVVRNLSNVETIDQICSSCNCQPPYAFTVCFSKEDCPLDTCKVDCGTHYCCYNEQGISIKSLPKEI
jgi:hypothetical protein